MRWGTLAAATLILAGSALSWAGADAAMRGAITGGCAVLIALPVCRLLIMLDSFRRAKARRYIAITILVLGLVGAAAIVGLLR